MHWTIVQLFKDVQSLQFNQSIFEDKIYALPKLERQLLDNFINYLSLKNYQHLFNLLKSSSSIASLLEQLNIYLKYFNPQEEFPHYPANASTPLDRIDHSDHLNENLNMDENILNNQQRSDKIYHLGPLNLTASLNSLLLDQQRNIVNNYNHWYRLYHLTSYEIELINKINIHHFYSVSFRKIADKENSSKSIVDNNLNLDICNDELYVYQLSFLGERIHLIGQDRFKIVIIPLYWIEHVEIKRESFPLKYSPSEIDNSIYQFRESNQRLIIKILKGNFSLPPWQSFLKQSTVSNSAGNRIFAATVEENVALYLWLDLLLLRKDIEILAPKHIDLSLQKIRGEQKDH